MKEQAESEWTSFVSDTGMELEPMESPLDVLSRAASMIETSARNSVMEYLLEFQGVYKPRKTLNLQASKPESLTRVAVLEQREKERLRKAAYRA
nr:hypothetical protein BgiMline_028873 [Biomphalaria glabrata]